MPAHFGDSLREYSAVRHQVGLLDLCQHHLLRFSGDDRVSFLNGMVSNDVKTLASSHGSHAAFLDLQGKILADTRIFCRDDSLLVDLAEPVKEKILQHLERHLVADEVEIQDLSSDYAMVSIQGPQAGHLLRAAASTDSGPVRDLDHLEGAIGQRKVLVIRATHTGEEGYDLVVSRADLIDVISRVQEAGKRFSLAWVGVDAQEMLRIEAGIPRYGLDMNADNLMLETGLDHAVSFDKGCYLGQEIVERIHSRGHVNKRLAGLILAGRAPVEGGGKIFHGSREIGKITSSAFSPYKDSVIALGYVQREAFNPGDAVVVQDRDKQITASLAALPIYPSAA